jgi:hypothetical protein
MLSLLLALLVMPATYSLLDSLGGLLRRIGSWGRSSRADASKPFPPSAGVTPGPLPTVVAGPG